MRDERGKGSEEGPSSLSSFILHPSSLIPRKIEDYRDYLLLLVRIQMGTRLSEKLDASDIVQQAVLRAHEKRAQFRGGTEGEWLAWLRAILASALAGAASGFDTQARDPGRERSLEAELERSSSRLESLLAADETSPSE
jgi:RNA polymerase sigma-70 factor (ECF subfamily)